MALDPNIILQAGRFERPDVGATLQLREVIGARRREEAAAAAKMARLGEIGKLAAGGDMTGAQNAALQSGDFDIVKSLAAMTEDQRKAAYEVSQRTAPLLLSLKSAPVEQRAGLLQQMAPQLTAYGLPADRLATLDLSDAGLDQQGMAASTIADIYKRESDATDRAFKREEFDYRKTHDAAVLERQADNAAANREFARGNAYISAGLLPPEGREDGLSTSTAPGTGPVGSQIEAAVTGFIPGVTVTSRQRSAARNKAVGGVGNSYHLSDNARDFTPPQGMGMGQFASILKQRMPQFEVINEGDHVHVEPRSRGRGAPRPIPGGRLDPNRPQDRVTYRTLTPAEARAEGLPEGGTYQRSSTGELKSVGGSRAGGGGTAAGEGMTRQQAGVARQKLSSLRAIEGQIKRVETAMGNVEKNGYTGWLGGRVPGSIDTASNTFDKAVAGLAPLIRQLTRVPGEGAMSDYESRLAEMTLPKRTDTPEGRREALAGIRDLIANIRAGYDEMTGGMGGTLTPRGIPTMTPEQVRKAPKGTRFRTSDGRVMVRQ